MSDDVQQVAVSARRAGKAVRDALPTGDRVKMRKGVVSEVNEDGTVDLVTYPLQVYSRVPRLESYRTPAGGDSVNFCQMGNDRYLCLGRTALTQTQISEVIDFQVDDFDISNDSTTRNMLGLTMPSAVARIGDLFIVRAAGNMLNNTGANVDYHFRFAIGGVNILDANPITAPTSVNARGWNLTAEIALRDEGLQGVTARLALTGVRNNGIWGGVTLSDIEDYANATADTTVDQTVELRMDMSTASVNAQFNRRYAILERVASV